MSSAAVGSSALGAVFSAQHRLAAPSPSGWMESASAQSGTSPADNVLRIGASPVEIAPGRFVSAVCYDGKFPGPLLRFKQEPPATVDVYNDTDTPEQLH
jgi:hypothetical protein